MQDQAHERRESLLLHQDPSLNELLGWLGIPRQTSSLLHENAIVLDAGTGQEYARMQGVGSQQFHFADDTTLGALSKTRDTIQLWDVPARTALHPLIAWASLGMAILLTGAWWYARRAVKMEI